MSNKPHSRIKRVSNTTISVKKKPVNSCNKKSKGIIGSLIKK